MVDDEWRNALHFSALRTRNFQPIEDNPLRLQQAYPETMESMFSPKRSKVHLSPSAAVSESLEMMDHHQHAILDAIEESLDALLKAFAPEVLKRRFANYAKVSDDHIQDNAWAWQMYNHYYSELISSRQAGFEKLFWEVFEQVYDRSMRKQELKCPPLIGQSNQWGAFHYSGITPK